MGGRVSKGSVLSDNQVIQTLNSHFIPYRFNITDSGFPAELKGLKRHKEIFYRFKKIFDFGFFGHVALTSDGKFMLGHAGPATKELYDITPCYHPDKYLTFLQKSLKFSERCLAIRSDATLDYRTRYQRLTILGEEIAIFIERYWRLRENQEFL